MAKSELTQPITSTDYNIKFTHNKINLTYTPTHLLGRQPSQLYKTIPKTLTATHKNGAPASKPPQATLQAILAVKHNNLGVNVHTNLQAINYTSTRRCTSATKTSINYNEYYAATILYQTRNTSTSSSQLKSITHLNMLIKPIPTNIIQTQFTCNTPQNNIINHCLHTQPTSNPSKRLKHENK
eukprot:gene2866-1851_t